MRALVKSRTTATGKRFAAGLFVFACLASAAGCDFGRTRSVAKNPPATPAVPTLETVIEIDAQGQYTIEGRPFTETELIEQLTKLSQDASVTPRVIIRGHAQAPLESALSVMNACRKLGIRDCRATNQSQETQNERALEIVLPQGSEALPLIEKPIELFINIDAAGKFVVEKEYLTEAQLLARLKQAAVDNPGRQTVIIRCDKRSPFNAPMTVMNVCNLAGIKDYRCASAPTDDEN